MRGLSRILPAVVLWVADAVFTCLLSTPSEAYPDAKKTQALKPKALAAHSVASTSILRPISIFAEPRDVPLVGTRSEGRIVVTAKLKDGSQADVTREAVLSSSDTKIARIGPDKVIRPVANGEVTIKVSCGGQSSTVRAIVSDAAVRKPIQFTREVVPVLTRAGCNQGSCHGSQYGKGGFKLSLLGFEPDVDYFALVKQAGGRRTLLSDPTHSLLLMKPTLALPHQGGNRLAVNSDDYKLLVGWLQDGAPGPSPKDPEVTKIEVFPAQRVMTKGKEQSLVVQATYSDGVVRDVTRWARLQVLNDSVASLSPEGVVKATGPGETGVMVRFGGQACVGRVTSPYARIARYPTFQETNFVDRLVAQKWKSLGLLPAGSCDDASFIRRLFLDVIGTPPAPEDVKAFLEDKAADKRTKLVDKVLDRPEYADYWTLKWGDLLRSNREKLGGPKGMWSFTNWIHDQFRDNRPFDQVVRELLTAQGSTFTTGPANYFRVASNPPDLCETTAQVFLGMRMQCTRCHHHPFEKWSQADYYKFAAFFARIGQKNSQEFGIFGGETVVRLNNGGDVYHPKTNQLMKPTPLGGYPDIMKIRSAKTAELIEPEPDASGDRRQILADWIARDNMLFAKNIVNRYWGYVMGRGLVEPIDDQRVTNPPTNPELLDALAKDFIAIKYDIKKLIRTICNSRVYQLSADVSKSNAADTMFYTHYFIRRLPAEVLLDSIDIATGSPGKFNGLPQGFRAIQLPDPKIDSEFLDTFGRAPRTIACECERAAEPNMGQALDLMMSDLMNNKVRNGEGTVAKLIAAKKPDNEIVEALYLKALNRPATPEELSKAREAISTTVEAPGLVPAKPVAGLPTQAKLQRSQDAKDRDRRAVLEDILWALLNSKEFVFNH